MNKVKKISCVKTVGGKTSLFVNGKAVDSIAYITYLTNKNCYADFSGKGYKLFSFPVFFGDNMLNEVSGLRVFTKGIFDDAEPDFSVFDDDVEKILAACPGALIFPRVNVNLSENWENANPDELNYNGVKTHPQRRRACFSSDKWAEEVKRELKVFIEHVNKMPYKEHIVGYQLAGGNTEEWFCYDRNGCIGKAFDQKHADLCGRERRRAVSDTVADRIIEFSRHIKELTDYKYVVGSFYGYTLECPDPYDGHHSLMKVLESEFVDFICSPVSYSSARKAAFEHPYMLPVNSLKLHGKLYFTENDTRTFLSRPLNDMPHYNTPVWFGPETEEESVDILKMHFAKAFINGHACWWFDMWGGWYKSNGIMDFMKKALELSREEVKPFCNEVALFIDEQMYAEENPEISYYSFNGNLRQEISKTGVPFDIYLAEDFESVKSSYKAAVLVEVKETYLTRKIKNGPLPVLLVKDTVSSDCFSLFYENKGLHFYSREGNIIYANSDYIFLHTVCDGRVKITPKRGKGIFEVFENKEYPLSFYSNKGKSYLFKVI